MNHQIIGLVIDTTGAFVMMALAVWVWRVRPQARMNRVFAQLVSLVALGAVSYNIRWLLYFATGADDSGADLLGGVGAAFFILSAPFIILLERSLPEPSDPRRSLLPRWSPTVLALLYLTFATPPIIGMTSQTGIDVSNISTGVAMTLVTAAFLYLIVRLAIRYDESGPDEATLRWQAATVALAVGGFPFFASATAAIEVPFPGSERSPFYALALIPMILCALAWIVAGTRRDGRLAIVTGLVFLTLVLAGMAATSLFGSIAAINSGAIGVLRLAGTALLAYTIVRHQLFDIELKLKWTLSRGTIAGIFIATFFVASEGAQALFSEFARNELVGIMAAGLLVFALAPLQRFADRLSDVALPGVADTPAYRAERRKQIYVAAIRSALRDGVVTERERDVLATLADELGLTSKEALALERRAAAPGAG